MSSGSTTPSKQAKSGSSPLDGGGDKNDELSRINLAPRKGILARILGDTLTRWGARVGAFWIGVLILLAVFAPFVANSTPLFWKQDGKWSSPLLEKLSAIDVILLVMFVVVVVLWFLRRIAGHHRLLIGFIILVVTSAVCFYTIEQEEFVAGGLWQYRETYKDQQASIDESGQLPAENERVQAVFTPIWYSPTDVVFERRSDAAKGPDGPSWAGGDFDHVMGQDLRFRDVASRLIHGSRIALSIGVIATGISVVIGVIIGGLMGFFTKWVDMIGMRLVEIFEFIPQLYLLLMFAAFYPSDTPEIIPGLPVSRIYLMMVIIGLTGWAGNARFIRAEFLKLRNQDFVMAAKACGLPLRSILFRHMLPNGLAPVLVSASFGIASAILYESTLSFLGLGLKNEPSWGALLDGATRGPTFIWWLATFPAAAIFFTVFAYNLIGESLRDAVDPHTKRLQES